MNKAKIKLIANVPCTLTLENPVGKESTSKYHEGIEYMYSVVCQGEASVLFLPYEGSVAIRNLGARAGDEIELLKTMQGKTPYFQARFAIPPSNLPPRPPVQQPQGTRWPITPAQVAATPTPQQGMRMLAPQTQRVAQPEAAQAPYAPVPDETPGRPPVTIHPLEEMMARCLFVGGRALWKAYTDLRESGCDFDKPMIEDVRAVGITMYIERTRK